MNILLDLTAVYIKIGGCAIKIIFKKYKNPFVKERIFKLRLINSFKQFISTPIAHPHFELLITGSITYQIFSKNNNNYISYCIRVSPNKFQTFYHISEEQLMYIIRGMCQQYLTSNSGCFLHASAIGYKNKVVIFLGKSGAGKSTIIRMLKNLMTPIADDMLIVKKEKAKYVVYQTPFPETNKYHPENMKFDLMGCIFLRKSQKNSLKKIKIEPDKLHQQLFSTPDNIAKQLMFVEKFADEIHSYQLDFNLKGEEELKLHLLNLLRDN